MERISLMLGNDSRYLQERVFVAQTYCVNGEGKNESLSLLEELAALSL